MRYRDREREKEKGGALWVAGILLVLGVVMRHGKAEEMLEGGTQELGRTLGTSRGEYLVKEDAVVLVHNIRLLDSSFSCILYVQEKEADELATRIKSRVFCFQLRKVLFYFLYLSHRPWSDPRRSSHAKIIVKKLDFFRNPTPFFSVSSIRLHLSLCERTILSEFGFPRQKKACMREAEDSVIFKYSFLGFSFCSGEDFTRSPSINLTS